MDPATVVEMDVVIAGGCSNPECKGKHHYAESLFLRPLCHKVNGCQVEYYRGGILKLSCPICDKPIVEIAVAGRKS